MPAGRLTLSVLCGALLAPVLIPSLQSVARAADVYHAVAVGETLSSVAAKYRVTTDQLRATNGLKESDTAPLSAMLLRIPGSNDTTATAPAATAPKVTPEAKVNWPAAGFGNNSISTDTAAPLDSGSGTISKTLAETVRTGDTWDSIAARYRAAGHDVSTDALRRRNGWIAVPPAGTTVIVPIGQLNYSAIANPFASRVPVVSSRVPVASLTASAQTVPSSSSASNITPTNNAPTNMASSNISMAPRSLAGGVLASGEIDLPFVQDNTPQQPPVFGASAEPRRGSLPSRGGFGQLTRNTLGGDVRILSPGEQASAPPQSSGRMNSVPTTSSSIARVARVSGTGARIRRLPQASAVTLYNCAKGTQLAVLRTTGAWSAVLMSDRSTGWLPSKYLSMTPQTVDVSAQISSADPGGQVNGYARNYAGENPMVSQALRWLGTPYRYGGTSRSGIDCSSLVQHAFAACGYRLPRTAAQQATVGVTVVPAQLRAGDRLYFSASGTRIDHTGLYMGDGLFVHASGSGRQVMVSNLFTPRNWNIFVGARR